MRLSKQEIEETWEIRDGRLFWRHSRKQVKAGDEAGCLNTLGYRVLSYSGRQWKAHRIIYAYHTGEWPSLVDHINGDRSDNRIENLRALSFADNSANTNKNSGSVPYRGVSKRGDRYRAFIQVRGKREFLGYFNTAEEASLAYRNRRGELLPFVPKGENV